ncbi:protein translocase subunit SecD [Oerskovia flava]|uniref:protein translocase subunit SecD n=1 Tax=Oerskovia flava TaxID=2986422 RepID=UPI00223F9305|nr:protein translocase subunit SecD [Oerskovia sp. JB1-3-2]
MATSSTRRARPARTLVTFGIILLALFGTLFAGVSLDGKSEDNPGGASWAPGLALDLEGGTQLILEAVTTDGSDVTEETITQAIAVIRQRVDSSGVAEAEITSQGSRNIVVGIPGEVSQETVDLVVTAAQMRFRPVLEVGFPMPVDAPEEEGDESQEPESEESATDGDATEDATTEDDAAAEDSASDETTEGADETVEDTEGAGDGTPTPTDPSDLAQITPEIREQFDALDCTLPENQVGGGADVTDAPLVTCAEDGTLKYILGPVEIEGTEITNASSGLRVNEAGVTTNEWVVNLEFNSTGAVAFRDSTSRLSSLPPPQNAFAVVLDGLVVSAPSLSGVIPNGQAEISGSFTRESAATLANQLNFGALPLSFEVQSQEQISATLGGEQLRSGLIAGLIGLGLIVVFFIVQYRALGLVTVASLVLAGVLTYGLIAVLSWTQGYRLSLPGVAGLIVSVGIISDSFILYYERIRDEMRDGRSLQSAVEKGWERARRTILASDAVNLLAATVLYMLSVGGVRGFAFTLGLMTIIDIIVVFLFTYPTTRLLARTRFFASGHRWSGLDPQQLGARARYVGRGRFSGPAEQDEPAYGSAPAASRADEQEVQDAPTGTAPARPRREPVPAGARSTSTPRPDGPRLTIAERRAAERRAAAERDAAGAADAETEEKR